jgi:hypothetical protein
VRFARAEGRKHNRTPQEHLHYAMSNNTETHQNVTRALALRTLRRRSSGSALPCRSVLKKSITTSHDVMSNTTENTIATKQNVTIALALRTFRRRSSGSELPCRSDASRLRSGRNASFDARMSSHACQTARWAPIRQGKE